MNSIETVVVPWDFSIHALAALEFAIESFPESQINVICILEQPVPYSSIDWGAEANQRAATACREEFNNQAKLGASERVKFFVEFGDPAPEILRFVNRQRADRVVLSTRGQSVLKQILLGSVARKVSIGADCPVVLLPQKWLAKQSAMLKENNQQICP